MLSPDLHETNSVSEGVADFHRACHHTPHTDDATFSRTGFSWSVALRFSLIRAQRLLVVSKTWMECVVVVVVVFYLTRCHQKHGLGMDGW